MSHHKRYFTNTLKDYDANQPDDDDFSVSHWKQKISEMISIIVDHQPPSAKDCDGGLYVGCAGVGYMLYHVSRSPVFAADSSRLLQHAAKYMAVAADYARKHKRDAKTNAAFLLGSLGVYAVSAAVHHAAGDEASYTASVAAMLPAYSPVPFTAASADEMLVGRAGRVAAARWLDRAVGRQSIPTQLVEQTRDEMIESGRRYAKANNSPSPLMYAYYDTEYLGAAHGLSAILQQVLTAPATSAAEEVRGSVDYVLSTQTADGNFPCTAGEVALVHWCHGAPGVVYMLAQAWLAWSDHKYLAAAEKCGDVTWERGLLRKGPGICHGVAGSAYVFLLLHRLTRHPRHLHRARQFARFLSSESFKREARTPDCPYSLYEGLAGTVCFLVDLLHPDSAAFPFMDVF